MRQMFSVHFLVQIPDGINEANCHVNRCAMAMQYGDVKGDAIGDHIATNTSVQACVLCRWESSPWEFLWTKLVSKWGTIYVVCQE